MLSVRDGDIRPPKHRSNLEPVPRSRCPNLRSISPHLAIISELKNNVCPVRLREFCLIDNLRRAGKRTHPLERRTGKHASRLEGAVEIARRQSLRQIRRSQELIDSTEDGNGY